MSETIRTASVEAIIYGALNVYGVSKLAWPLRSTETVEDWAAYAVGLMARQTGIDAAEIRRRLRSVDNMAIRRVIPA